MTAKPAYEELEQRINHLEKELAEIERSEEVLLKSHEALKKQFRERTAELNKANNALQSEVERRGQAQKTLVESEVRYRHLIESAREIIYTVSLDAKIVSMNPALENITGWSSSECIGKHLTSFVHRDDWPLAMEMGQRALNGENPPIHEMRILSKSGEYVSGEFSITPLILKGSVVGILGVGRDITERKKTEEALRESEEKYRLVIDNAAEGIVVIQDGIIKFVNHQVVDFSGYSEEDLSLKPFAEFIHPDEREMVLERHQKRHDGEVIPRVYPLKVIQKKGDERWVEVNTVVTTWEGRTATLAFLNDITERKQTEDALRESEAQKRAILDASLDRIRYIDQDMRIIWANKATAEGLDVSSEELVGQTCYEIFVDRDTPCEGCPAEKAQKTGQIERAVMYQGKVKGIAGESYWDTYCVPLENETGEIESFVQVARNITGQTKAMDALRQSEETLKAILAVCPVGICLVCNRTLDWANAAMYRILGYQEGSLIGEDAKVIYLDDEEFHRVGRDLYGGIDETGIGQTETRWITKEGGVIDCHLQASPLDPHDPGKGYIVAAMDITDRKRAEEHIHALTQQLMKAQENERQRISLYLHDDVAQNLSTLKIGLETIFDDQPTPPRKLTQQVSKFSQILQRAISAVRDLAYDQRPPSLDQLGLVQALFQYCESFSEKHGLKVDFQSAGMEDLRLNFETEINLYRLVQEGLTNVRKHADANRAIVRLVAVHPHIILRIEDNGKGFDVGGRLLKALDEKQMGLQGMEERVNLLNGKLGIQSCMGEGTKISIEVPYKGKKSGSEKNDTHH